jgi:hypothetical protein
MKLGPVLFEAKLTQSDFQTQKAAFVEGYRDLKAVFDCRKLSRSDRRYVSYQLLRNVLAAYALSLSFCVLLDARRPDLVEQWYAVMSCVRPMDLRTRCEILTWQDGMRGLNPNSGRSPISVPSIKLSSLFSVTPG